MLKLRLLPTSIRWRLPLSYAAIALLATLALGLVLLTILRRYYHQQELDYLSNNARAISTHLPSLFEADLPSEVLGSQLDSFAFLSQSRIRLLDANGDLLADSGAPQQHEVTTFSFEKEVNVELEHDPLTQMVTQTVAISETQMDYTFIAIRTVDQGRVLGVSEQAGPLANFPLPLPSENVRVKETVLITGNKGTDFDRLLIWRGEGLPELPLFVSRFPTVGTPYGFEFKLRQGSEGERSDQIISQPVYQEGELLGYIELSEGPAYGRQILQSVAWSWAIAGLVAVLLAMLVGWRISRQLSLPLMALTEVTAQMAGGNLSARADAARLDEFGMLAYRFNEMAHQVEETVVTLRRFVADAAHELHTPLTALRTDLELMGGQELAEKSLRLVNRATTQVIRLETLTNDLLDLSRLETKSAEVDYNPFRLNELLDNVSEIYASQAEQLGLAFSFNLPDEPFMICGNEAQLHRAVGNLLDNALKFTPRGGVITLDLHSVTGTEWVEISVEDEGIGIPADELPQLFSRFHRGRNATHYPGSGLGLAIVKAIVEGHGGQVAAQNRESGARFTIRLPVVTG